MANVIRRAATGALDAAMFGAGLVEGVVVGLARRALRRSAPKRRIPLQRDKTVPHLPERPTPDPYDVEVQ